MKVPFAVALLALALPATASASFPFEDLTQLSDAPSRNPAISQDKRFGRIAAFARHRIVPRMLRGAERPDASVELFGRRLAAPLLLAPVGVLELAHRDADLAVARAARRRPAGRSRSVAPGRSLGG